MKKTISATLFLISTFGQYQISSHAFASDTDTCTAISNDERRLECYDLLFKKTVSRTTPAGKGQWSITEEKSMIDDSSKVVVSVTNSEPVQNRFGQTKTMHLIIACRENKTALWINFDQFMSDHAGGGRVTYRIDKEKARSINMRNSNDHMALGLWSGGQSIPFIKKLKNAKSLLVRATPHSSSSITTTFPVAGIDKAIAPLSAACGWKM